ncbi:hypothetical protein [Dysgonomonas sp. HDW5B]|nr:hypothetical protein [Dysgonomonas sp. HDW5B]
MESLFSADLEREPPSRPYDEALKKTVYLSMLKLRKMDNAHT